MISFLRRLRSLKTTYTAHNSIKTRCWWRNAYKFRWFSRAAGWSRVAVFFVTYEIGFIDRCKITLNCHTVLYSILLGQTKTPTSIHRDNQWRLGVTKAC